MQYSITSLEGRKGALGAGSLQREELVTLKGQISQGAHNDKLVYFSELIMLLDIPCKDGQPQSVLRLQVQTCPSIVHRQSSPSEVQQKPSNLGQVFRFQIVPQLLLTDPHMALLLGLGKVSS